ncbi:MAG: metal ABC transporter ATP-binding protein [Nitrospirales bacterium]
MKPIVSLSRVTVGYGRDPILRDCTLTLTAGETLALLGPNGSGKSSLLKTMLGIVPPLSGKIRWEEPQSGAGRACGYVPQRGTLEMALPLTVREVVEMGAYGRLGLCRPLGRHGRERVDWCLRELGLTGLDRRPYPHLSGGQQQRVLIARALAVEPTLLVLDEPLAGVDAQTAEAIVTLLGKLTTSDGLALLWVSHQLAAVRTVVKEVLWIEDGHMIRGPVDEMLAPDRVRTFLRDEGLVDAEFLREREIS